MPPQYRTTNQPLLSSKRYGKRPSWRLLVVMLIIGISINSCRSTGNFSQYDGFEAIRSGLSSTLPSTTEQQLLQRFQPRLFIAEKADPPLDFYNDYIARGVLQIGEKIIPAPSQKDLNDYKNNLTAMFTYQPIDAPLTPTAYGGIHYAEVDLPLIGRQTLTFLSYHFAFRMSGLPAGISPSQRIAADWIGDSGDWHQLDNYTAAFIVLRHGEPMAVLLQQHNYMRTYLIGGQDFPAQQTVALDVAISSNELYPHSPDRRTWRTVGFLTDQSIDYLLGLTDTAPSIFSSAMDITHGQQRVPYSLQFLPPDDAFYVFEGWLGERRLLPGRDGPPGAIYRTLPTWWPLPVSLYAFYWQEKDSDYADIIRQDEGLSAASIERLKHRLATAILSAAGGPPLEN